MSPALFLRIVAIETKRRMSYRADFWLLAVGGLLLEFGLAFFLWQAMFAAQGGATIGGFTLPAMILYYVVVSLVSRVIRGLAFDEAASGDIYTGGLNRYLVFPTGYLPFKYAQSLGGLTPALIQGLILGVALLVLVQSPAGVSVTPTSILIGGVTLLLGNALYFLMAFPLHCLAFWAENVWSLQVSLRLLTSLAGGQFIPLSLFPDPLREALSYTPFPLLFYVPAEALLGRLPFDLWAHHFAVGVVWTFLLLLLAHVTWRRGCLRYTGVGM